LLQRDRIDPEQFVAFAARHHIFRRDDETAAFAAAGRER
jgi:hypothetical protein